MALSVRDVVKRYGAMLALDGLTFEIAEGSSHALVGENGAGKSTLVKIISGITRPESGEIEISGKRVRRIRSPVRAAEMIGRTVDHAFLDRRPANDRPVSSDVAEVVGLFCWPCSPRANGD